MKAICCIILGFGNATLATTFNGISLDSLAVASLATFAGFAGLFSWRWLLSNGATQRLAEVRISE